MRQVNRKKGEHHEQDHQQSVGQKRRLRKSAPAPSAKSRRTSNHQAWRTRLRPQKRQTQFKTGISQWLIPFLLDLIINNSLIK